MAIRLRTIHFGAEKVRVALCAAETDKKKGDIYLDDSDHGALAAKFAHDYFGETITTVYGVEWGAMATQKLRDAEKELTEWLKSL